MAHLYAVVAFLSLCTTSSAHDIYRFLTQPSGESCCRSRDCRPARYRITASGVEMFVDGAWHTIPDSKIQRRTLEGDRGETGGSHWCGMEARNHPRMHTKFTTYCAFLPPDTAWNLDMPLKPNTELVKALPPSN
jgi:hypothetical protein